MADTGELKKPENNWLQAWRWINTGGGVIGSLALGAIVTAASPLESDPPPNASWWEQVSPKILPGLGVAFGFYLFGLVAFALIVAPRRSSRAWKALYQERGTELGALTASQPSYEVHAVDAYRRTRGTNTVLVVVIENKLDPATFRPTWEKVDGTTEPLQDAPVDLFPLDTFGSAREEMPHGGRVSIAVCKMQRAKWRFHVWPVVEASGRVPPGYTMEVQAGESGTLLFTVRMTLLGYPAVPFSHDSVIEVRWDRPDDEAERGEVYIGVKEP